MARNTEWDLHMGRRVRLRDLHILLAVAQWGSMAKAASNLGISQPAVSEAIAGLEHALAVRLLERDRRGVRPTPQGQALMRAGKAAFDELRQGIKQIDMLSDPGSGELRIACPNRFRPAFLAPSSKQ